MGFDFATAGRIIFGAGTAKELVPAAASLGRRALFVRGRSGERSGPWIDRLQTQGIQVQEFHVSGEPMVETVVAGLAIANEAGIELVIAMGGGSVIDAGKAIATLRTNPGTAYDYLEVVGAGKPLIHPAVPVIALPTTAGTGSEVTRNAVLGVPERGVKVSLRGSQMLPRVAIVDPELTYTMPREVTAASGMDALTQLIEPFVSVGANAMTDAICRDGIGRVAASLRKAFDNGADTAARDDMALASLFGGMALANSKLGAVHGFAGPIGGMFTAGHGAICARLLPPVVEANLRALRDRASRSPMLDRFEELGALLTGRRGAAPEDGIAFLYELRDALDIPALGAHGVRTGDVPEIVERAKKSSSMKGNPIGLTDRELAAILEAAL